MQISKHLSIIFTLQLLFLVIMLQAQSSTETQNSDTTKIVVLGRNGCPLPVTHTVEKKNSNPFFGSRSVVIGESYLPISNEDYLKGEKSALSKNPTKTKAGIPFVYKIADKGFEIQNNDTILSPKIYEINNLNYSQNDKAHFLSIQNGDSIFSPKIVKYKQAKKFLAKELRTRDNALNNIAYLDIKQGLVSSYITNVYEDKKGKFWFATDGMGVTCYDGKYFRTYNTENGLSNNYVRAILEDSKGNMWFGTKGGGVTCLNGKYFIQYTEKQGLSSNIVLSIIESKNGNIWFGTQSGGVTCFSPSNSKHKTPTFTHYTTKQGFGGSIVLSILEGRNGKIYFATFDAGLTIYTPKGLSNSEYGTFTHYTTEQGLSNDCIWSVLEDKYNNIWLGSLGGGATCINSFDTISNVYLTTYTTEQGLGHNKVLSLMESRTGKIWFGTYGGGLTSLSSDRKTLKNYTEKQGLTNNFIRSLKEDESGNIWIATNGGGVNVFKGDIFEHYTTKQGFSSDFAWSIKENKGRIWFGTDGSGISCYNPTTNKNSNNSSFTHFTTEQTLCENDIFSILVTQEGDIWFGSNGGGLSRYSETKNTAKFTNYTEKNGLLGNSILTSFQDNNGDIWFGTDQGISKFHSYKINDKTEESFIQYLGDEKLNFTTTIIEDTRNCLWFGSEGGGVTFYNSKKSTLTSECFVHFTEKQGLSNDVVRGVLLDKKGNLWFATSDKVTILLKKGVDCFYNLNKSDCELPNDISENIIYLSKEDGISSNILNNIFYDKNNNIWLGTETGINKLSLVKSKDITKNVNINTIIVKEDVYRINKYYIDEGFTGGDTYGSNSYAVDSQGDIWWGTGKQITKYSPNEDKLDTLKPKIIIDNVFLFSEKIDWDLYASNTPNNGAKRLSHKGIELDSVPKWSNLPQNLILSYKENHLTFSYGAISWSAPEKILYQFRLINLEDSDNEKNSIWSSLTSNTEAVFSNVLPGLYDFQVKSLSGSGVWSNTVDYSFEVTPPWWKTWWAKTIEIVFFGLLLLLFYRKRVAILKERQKELEQTVKDRTLEVVMQKEEIQEKNARLNKSNEEISAHRDLVLLQKEHIEEQKTEMEDSIQYAKRIQQAVLPSKEYANAILNKHFIIFKPHSVVSGDFYWTIKLDEWTIITVADCTGHGVPGAFMSMLGISYLNEIVRNKEVTSPADVLNKLRTSIIEALKQTGEEGTQKDGMDMSILAIHKDKQKALWAGANNPLWIVRKQNINIKYDDNAKMVEVIKGDKMPVAVYLKMDDFTNHEIDINTGDRLFLFSDGFADQFGGAKDKKFMYKTFKRLIAETSSLTINEQSMTMQKALDDWMNFNGIKYDQIDDITVIGLEI